MRFKLSLPLKKGQQQQQHKLQHSDFACALGWSSCDEVVSCGDDHKLMRWNVTAAGESTEMAVLPDTLYPTDIHWYPKVTVGGGQRKAGGGSKGADLFVLTSTDGKFYLISKDGRVEKAIDGHRGAILCVRWSYDGGSLVTVGEDGHVKIWSRNGMLRSTLSQTTRPIYSAAWSPENDKIIYCFGGYLIIKPVQAGSKPIQWKAHDGVVLCIDWNVCNNLIVSGGEDCRYMLWDAYGRNLYTSTAHDFPITSIAWSLDGQMFAVGSYDTLRLCHQSGWSYSLDKPKVGSIYNLAWSPDGTQAAAATASGRILFTNVIERKLVWKNYEVLQTSANVVEVKNSLNGAKEKLEMRDRVVHLCLEWDRLVVATSNQCFIYNSNNWNTPTAFDLKECSISLILMAEKYFMLIDGSLLQIHSYDGRLQSSPKIPASRVDVFNERTVALCSDTLVLCDRNDPRFVHVFDVVSGKTIGDGRVNFTQEVLELALDQCGPAIDRKLAFLDKINDVFVCYIRKNAPVAMKIGNMTNSLLFNDHTNMLTGIQDNRLLVWIFPSVSFVDKDLLQKTIISKESNEFGKSPKLNSFVGNHVTISRHDGSCVNISIPPFCSMLLSCVDKKKWEEALRLCRRLKEECLWSVLAAAAIYAKNLTVAETSYAEINEAEKVNFLKDLNAVSSKDIKNAETTLMCGNRQAAENILLQSGNIFRAIMLNVSLYQWDRALDLATKQNVHVDTVCAYRQMYLKDFNRKETNKRFLQLNSEIEIDWNIVQEKVENEYETERSK